MFSSVPLSATLLALSTLTSAVAIPIQNANANLQKYDTIASTLDERAGAPARRNISDCTLTSVYPSTVENPGYGFLPSSSFISANQIYSYTLIYSTFYGDEEETLTSCLESCAGYGNEGQCKSVFLAYNVTSSDGTKPTQENFQCLMFGVDETETDFVAPTINGTYTYPKAVNIECPSS